MTARISQVIVVFVILGSVAVGWFSSQAEYMDFNEMPETAEYGVMPESFGSMTPYFVTGEFGSWTETLDDGVFQLQNESNEDDLYRITRNMHPETDQAFTTSFSVDAADKSVSAGLLYGDISEGNMDFYVIGIVADNCVSIARHSDEKTLEDIWTRRSSNGSLDCRSKNTLTVVEDGSELEVYINGHLVHRFTPEGITKGSAGVFAHGCGTYRFHGFSSTDRQPAQPVSFTENE